MIAITVHHFHILYIAKSSVWLNVKDKAARFLEMSRASLWGKEPVPVPLDAIDTQEQPPVATKSIIELREDNLTDILCVPLIVSPHVYLYLDKYNCARKKHICSIK